MKMDNPTVINAIPKEMALSLCAELNLRSALSNSAISAGVVRFKVGTWIFLHWILLMIAKIKPMPKQRTILTIDIT